MLYDQIINECQKGFEWKIIRTARGFLYAVYRMEKDELLNIAETTDYSTALQKVQNLKMI